MLDRNVEGRPRKARRNALGQSKRLRSESGRVVLGSGSGRWKWEPSRTKPYRCTRNAINPGWGLGLLGGSGEEDTENVSRVSSR